jgi:RNA polymerase sigma-70 factor (ECF subfamily)
MISGLETAFTEHRKHLWGLLYRMTGSAADADDLLQETFAKTIERPPPRLDLPLKPWLARVALNLARDHLRARKRSAYTGPWLPAPIETSADELDQTAPPSFDRGAEWRYDLLESVSYAFLLALEAMTPAQRAVLLLRDVFDYSVRETAEALDLSEANAKQLHLRAKKRMDAYHRTRRPTSTEVRLENMTVLGALVQGLVMQDVAAIEALLAHDVRSLNDGNGEFVAATRPIHGAHNVARFLVGVTKKGGQEGHFEVRTVNGLPAMLLVYSGEHGRIARKAVFSVELNAEGRVQTVYTVLATRKLLGLQFASPEI